MASALPEMAERRTEKSGDPLWIARASNCVSGGSSSELVQCRGKRLVHQYSGQNSGSPVVNFELDLESGGLVG